MYKKHTKNPHKTHRKKLRLTFTHPTAPEFFSDFLICFNLTRPLNLHNYHLFTPHKINLKGEMNLKGQKMSTLVRMMQKWKKNYCLMTLMIAARAGALVQWLKLPAWKVGDRGF